MTTTPFTPLHHAAAGFASSGALFVLGGFSESWPNQGGPFPAMFYVFSALHFSVSCAYLYFGLLHRKARVDAQSRE